MHVHVHIYVNVSVLTPLIEIFYDENYLYKYYYS